MTVAEQKTADEKALLKVTRELDNQDIDFLCDFYNLQIEPHIKSGVPYRDLMSTLQSTKKVLSQRDLRRTKQFLRKTIRKDAISRHKFWFEITKLEVEERLPYTKQAHLEHIKNVLHQSYNQDLSEWLPDDKWKQWYKTPGLYFFLLNYLMVHRTIDDLLLDRLHEDSKHWLEDLYNEEYPPTRKVLKPTSLETAQVMRKIMENRNPEKVLDLPDSPSQQKSLKKNADGYYDLTTLALLKDCETLERQDPPQIFHDWAGVCLYCLTHAIFEGIYEILEGIVKVQRCAREDCNKIMRIPTAMGGHNKKYCSSNCNKQAYLQRKKQAG